MGYLGRLILCWYNLYNNWFVFNNIYPIIGCIGYGSIYPVTTGGQVATIFYAMIGIPLTISILNDWGGILFNCTISFWQWVCKHVMHATHKLQFVLLAYRMSLACPQGCGTWFRQHCCRPTNIRKTSK